jgi:SAM-dependent methyltransferase
MTSYGLGRPWRTLLPSRQSSVSAISILDTQDQGTDQVTANSAQYDRIGSSYEQYAQTGALKKAECHTFLSAIGPLAGKEVLDLACGAGFYTRLLKSAGAARVVGVDISPEMVRLAELNERSEPLGIDYQVHDARALPPLGEFHLTTAAYLLNYAASGEELLSMCRGAHASLAPGGRFVAVTANPDFDFARSDSSAYGVRVLNERLSDGRYQVDAEFLTDPPAPFSYYRWSSRVYESALLDAGFTSVRWLPIEPAPDDVAARSAEYWHELRENCLCIGLVCDK